MVQFPIWVWILWVVGVIAAGVGLGYLIIFLFWRIERKFFPEVAVPKHIEPEVKKVEEPVEREIAPTVEAALSPGQNRLVRFTDVLHSKFNHPFKTANTIACWDLALKNGDEVRDTEGKEMKLQVIKPKSEAERTRYILVDKAGHHTISVILGKEHIKRETKLDFDKMSIIR
jgi:hypothetical protein